MSGDCRCGGCGKPLQRGDTFCGSCGRRVGPIDPRRTAPSVDEAPRPTESISTPITTPFHEPSAEATSPRRDPARTFPSAGRYTLIGALALVLAAIGVASFLAVVSLRETPQGSFEQGRAQEPSPAVRVPAIPAGEAQADPQQQEDRTAVRPTQEQPSPARPVPPRDPSAAALPPVELLGVPASEQRPPSNAAERYMDALSFDRWSERQQWVAEGIRYYVGQGVPRDLPRARALFERAAPDDGRAAFYLSRMFARGEGGSQDAGQSVRWLTNGAILGDAECQFTLGEMYTRGAAGVLAPDLDQAVRWLGAAAAQGHQDAASRLRTLGR